MQTTVQDLIENINIPTDPLAFEKSIKILRKYARKDKANLSLQQNKTHRTIDVKVPVATADDTYHALKFKIPHPDSFLMSLPEYAGNDIVDCKFEFPEIGTIIVPGLNSEVFRTHSVTAYFYGSSFQSTGYEIIRLPPIYVLLNQCLGALYNEIQDRELELSIGQQSTRRPYNWSLAAENIRDAASAVACRLLDINALRIRQGAGFMAIAQSNPNLSKSEIGIGLELARKILKDLQSAEHTAREIEIGESKKQNKKIEYQFNTVSDISGLKLSVVCRFPATTSESVRLGMHMVICGRGRCCYLNPAVLKTGMEGDVDGDLIFAEII